MNCKKIIINNEKSSVGAAWHAAQKQNNKNNTMPVGACIARPSGITLIALIITIIVMLILAGVVLNLSLGERGIFKTAKESKKEYIIAEMKEELELALNDLQLEKQGEATLDDVTQEWADNNKLKEYSTIIGNSTEINEKTATMTKEGVTAIFIIDAKLNIIDGDNAGDNKQYQTITRNLDEGISIDNTTTKIANGNSYSATVSGKEEYILQTLTVIMGGEPVTVDVGTGKINIEKVTGDIVITATAKKLNLQITEPIIGTSASATESVEDNSQTVGTKLYINFSATLEGSNCTIVYKANATKEVPFEVVKNGKYVFIIKGTYSGKIVEKEKEVQVNKYKPATNLVKYDAGEWTQEEINELTNSKLYMINTEKTYNTTYRLSDEEGLNFTFGGFTYKGDSANYSYINEGTIITSRNQSVDPQDEYGEPFFNGWQVFESEEKEVNGKTRTYVTKLIHAGSPENFVYSHVSAYDAWRAEYLLTGIANHGEKYKKLDDNITEINARNWNMYKDKTLDDKGYIKQARILTYDEANAMSDQNRTIGSFYWLELGWGNSGVCSVGNDGRVSTNRSNYCFGVRPVIEMNEGVYISSGSGTEEDPYILAKE